jgi:beta-galactosidase
VILSSTLIAFAQTSVTSPDENKKANKSHYDTTTARRGVPWLDETFFEENRLPMHASFYSYESDAIAAKGDWHLSKNYQSLDGPWRFKYVDRPAEIPEGFEKNLNRQQLADLIRYLQRPTATESTESAVRR